MGSFIIQNKMLVACYIANEEEELLKKKDFIDKGTTLIIKTEETRQEVAISGHRYDNSLYWEYSYNGFSVPDIDAFNDEDDIEAQLLAVIDPADIPDGIMLKPGPETILEDGYTGAEVPTTDENPNPRSYHNMIESFPRTHPTVNDGRVVRLVTYAETLYTPAGPEDDPPASYDPGIMTFTWMKIQENLQTDFVYTEDKNVEIGTGDSIRKMQAYATYENVNPTLSFRVTEKQTLAHGFDLIAASNTLRTFDKLNKVIIDMHMEIGMNYYNLDSYVITESTINNLFERFDSIELRNTILEFPFPDKELKIKNLILDNTIVYINNCVLNVEESISMTNCIIKSKFKGKSGYLTILKGIGKTNFQFNTWRDPVFIKIIPNKIQPLDEMTIIGVTFDFNYSDTKTKGSLLEIHSINTLKIMDIKKVKETNYSNLSSIRIKNCGEVLIDSLILPEDHSTSVPDIIIQGGSSIAMSNLNSRGQSDIPIAVISGLSDIGKIRLSDINVTRPSIFKLLNMSLTSFSLMDFDIVCDQIYTESNFKTNKMIISSGKLNIRKDWNLTMDKFISNDLSVTAKNINFGVINKANIKQLYIHCDIFNITIDHYLTKVVLEKCKIISNKINFSKNYIDPTDENIAIKAKMTLKNDSFLGSEFKIDGIENIVFKVGRTESKSFLISNIKKLQPTDHVILPDSVSKFNISDSKLVGASFIIEDNNGIPTNIAYKNITGKLLWKYFFGKKSTKGIVNLLSDKSKTLTEFSCINKEKTKDINVIVNSIDSLSSAFGSDNIKSSNVKVNLLPSSKDFKYGLETDSMFEKYKSGKDLTTYIHFGHIKDTTIEPA